MTQHGFDQCFRFSICPGAVGLGVAPADRELVADSVPVDTVVGAVVVAEDAFDRDAALGIPAGGAS